jgi:TRAP-type C4-dicarboxylate transport system substrate-binding protein
MTLNKKLRLIPKMKRGLAFVLAAGMAAFAQSAWSAEFEWRYYSVSPLGHPYSQILDKHVKEIYKRSCDKLKIHLVYFGETPYKGAEAEKLMRDGLGQMTEWLVSYSTSTYPLLSAPELPFLPTKPMAPAEHIEAVDKAWESPSVAAELERELFLGDFRRSVDLDGALHLDADHRNPVGTRLRVCAIRIGGNTRGR